jgi:sterol desaturase/sphingolipid hydroxylase (fatty acid hydroxylase superfamily)
MENNILQYIAPLVFTLVRYFLIAGTAFVIFYKLFPKRFSKNKIQARFAKKKDFIREILHSMQTTFILAVVGLLILKTPLKAYTQVYENIADFSLWWIPISVLLALVLQDTYFYWMHRTVHHPRFFKHIHLLHHKSINPSPWTSYSFHFFEGVLEALIAPIIFVLIPMHPLAILLFVFAGFSINVYGHLGYEIAPKWFRHSFLFEFMNTSTYHNNHHTKFNGNYGLYFRFWDRVMGTEHADYVKEYDEIQKRRFGIYKHNSVTVKSTFLVVLAVGVSFMIISAQIPKDVEGIWKDNNDGGIIKIYEKEGMYFGQLIEAEKPEDNKRIKAYGEIILMKNFKKKSATEYCCGTIYQPKEKRTIKATLVLQDENTLKINGKYGIFTGSRIWKRLER